MSKLHRCQSYCICYFVRAPSTPIKMESLLAYSSGSDSEETEQGKGREESVKKRKVTEMNKRDQNYLGDRNTRQLANKRPKPFLQSPDECKAVGIFSDLKQTASIIPQMSRSDHCGLSNDFNESSLSHVQAPSGRIDEKFVPSVISTMHRKFSSTSVSGSVNAKPYISKRERQELSQQKTTRPLSVNPVTFPLKPQLEGAEFISSSKEDDEGIRKNKKQVTSSRPPKQLLVSFEGHSQGVNCVRWHPSRSNLLLSASMDHSVCVWDTLGDAICLKLTHHTAAVKDGKWSLCGSQVLSCGYDKTARLVNLETGQEIVKFPHRNYVTCVQFHPTDSTLFLAGTFKSSILCWDARTGKISATYSACFGQVQDIAFLPHGNEFISAAEVIRRNSTDKGIMVWDFRSTAVLSNQIYQEAFTCTCLKVHPSESHFVAQSNGDYIALFSTKKPYKLNKFKRYEGHKVSGYHIGCDFSPGGSIICSGSADGHIYFYDHHSSHMISKLKAHSMPCMDVVFHPSLPHCVASCGWDGGVKIWK